MKPILSSLLGMVLENCNDEADVKLSRKRNQDPRPRCPVRSPCIGSFGNEDWQNRGRNAHTFRLYP